MKIISYSLFGSRTTEPWLFAFYLRGFVWNVKMNRLIYPGWQTHVEVDVDTFSDYDHIFNELKKHYGISYNVNIQEPLCKSMLWRLKPVFWADSEIVLCRDADAITTAREVECVYRWDKKGVFGINDDPAHNLPLMGGMMGVECKVLQNEYVSWEYLMSHTSGALDIHGSDQGFLMTVLHPLFNCQIIRAGNINPLAPYWTSDLTCRHIGSAGVVEMETIRFFKQHDPNSPFIETEKKYPHIFTWHL